MTMKADSHGLENGKLAMSPKAARCISSKHENPNRWMIPMEYEGLTLEEAREILLDVLKTIPKITVVKDEGTYMHAEAKTLIAEFFHDVEFFFDEEAKEIHFRSASRLGFTDFGANKRRMQSVVARFLNMADQYKIAK
jgi:uncharacterized protein (DUF1499 family)